MVDPSQDSKTDAFQQVFPSGTAAVLVTTEHKDPKTPSREQVRSQCCLSLCFKDIQSAKDVRLPFYFYSDRSLSKVVQSLPLVFATCQLVMSVGSVHPPPQKTPFFVWQLLQMWTLFIQMFVPKTFQEFPFFSVNLLDGQNNAKNQARHTNELTSLSLHCYIQHLTSVIS